MFDSFKTGQPGLVGTRFLSFLFLCSFPMMSPSGSSSKLLEETKYNVRSVLTATRDGLLVRVSEDSQSLSHKSISLDYFMFPPRLDFLVFL